MLSEVWTALSGLSGVCLACSLLSAAVVLRWTRSQTARGAVTRARQKQRAGLETMDKAVQRFRLQVKAGAGAGVGWRGEHGVGKAATSTARTPEGRLAGSADVSPGTESPPPRANAFRTLSAPGAAQREAEKKRTGGGGWALYWVKEELCPTPEYLDNRYQNAGGNKNR